MAYSTICVEKKNTNIEQVRMTGMALSPNKHDCS